MEACICFFFSPNPSAALSLRLWLAFCLYRSRVFVAIIVTGETGKPKKPSLDSVSCNSISSITSKPSITFPNTVYPGLPLSCRDDCCL